MPEETISDLVQSTPRTLRGRLLYKGIGLFLAVSFMKFFILVAFLVASALFVGVVTVATKTYLSRPSWMGSLSVTRPGRSRESEQRRIYTPQIVITGRINDGSFSSYEIAVVFGMTERNKLVEAEISRRGVELQDLLRSFFDLRTGSEFAVENEGQLKVGLKKRMNEFLRIGEIDEVLFPYLDVG